MDINNVNLITQAANMLTTLIRNLPLSDSVLEKQISQIIFLDLYFRGNINFETDILQLEEEGVKNNPGLLNELNKKYNYAFNEIGVFREKRVGSKGISNTADDILRRLGIECNTVSGHIVITKDNKKMYHRHYWNEIRINKIWYSYDFTLNLISYNHKKQEYKPLLKFIKMPMSPIDYSFIQRQSINVKIGGYSTPKYGSMIQQLDMLSEDFSKYSTMDRIFILRLYSNIEKIYNSMNL